MYRGSLQNYLIDTGDEVILVDTGLPAGFPDGAPEEIHDDTAFVSQLTHEIQPLVPGLQVVIVVDHNYSE